MSAFMVSKSHINALVAVAYYGPAGAHSRYWYAPYFHDHKLQREDLDELGDMLVKENLSSIHARYPDTISNPDATPGPCNNYWLEPFQFADGSKRPNVVQALKLIACYEYQSCEHDEWERSAARRYCEGLRHALINCLPGYEEAPWEWEDARQAA